MVMLICSITYNVSTAYCIWPVGSTNKKKIYAVWSLWGDDDTPQVQCQYVAELQPQMQFGIVPAH